MSSSYTIIGHTETCAKLDDDRVQGNISHAYLFSGPSHVGKSTVARRYAQRLQCTNGCYLSGEWISGSCVSCRAIESGAHMDVRILSPDEKGVIRIEVIRDMVRWMSIRSVSEYRICIIDDADTLTLQAAQALLKVLEEPPARGLCIVISHNERPLLPTLRSRMRPVGFALVPNSVLQEWVPSLDSKLSSLLDLIDGRPGRAVEYHEQPALQSAASVVHAQAQAISTQDLIDRFQAAKALAEEPVSARAFLTALIRYLRTELRSGDVNQQIRYAAALEDAYETLQSMTASTNLRLSLENLMTKL